jgi:aldehyde:ferredoxin oxidoreductase
LGRALFPFEWDYLQSLSGVLPPLSSETQPDAVLSNVLAQEKQKVLADLNSFCPLVVARIPLLTGPEIRELITGATGIELDEKGLMESIQNTLRIERALRQRFNPEKSEVDPLPLRLFNDPSEKRRLEEIVANYENSENGNEFLS